MDGRLALRMVLWSALAGSVVALAALLVFDWYVPGDVTIAPAEPAEIVIDIQGAVATPGLVRLPAGARLDDAIERAGGLTRAADASGLNLAARVADGERLVVPSRIASASPGAVGESAPSSGPAGGLIDVNLAGAAELEQLPGVGPAIAQRIIDYREANGPFASVDALDEVEGISPAMVEEFRPLVTAGE